MGPRDADSVETLRQLRKLVDNWERDAPVGAIVQYMRHLYSQFKQGERVSTKIGDDWIATLETLALNLVFRQTL